MKLIDYVLIAIIAAAVIFAVRAIRRGKGHGCCGGDSCNGNCSACGHHCDCSKH